ncbi:glucosaminidase domain-containing protein [Candidatus Sumerlaeota bacterium]|nr:glucosaminidase domain-containing protein [Candidatus Sumerlaeota bacterium]
MLNEKQMEFRRRVSDLAKKIAPRHGVDWRVMAATAILESGWGETPLAREAHNLFGIRSFAAEAGPDTFLLRSTEEGDLLFRRYPSDAAACEAYARLIGASRLYAPARIVAMERARKPFVERLARIYCPADPAYALKILQIVKMLESVS